MDECLVASEVEAESTGYYLRDVVVDVMEVVVDVTVCVFIWESAAASTTVVRWRMLKKKMFHSEKWNCRSSE